MPFEIRAIEAGRGRRALDRRPAGFRRRAASSRMRRAAGPRASSIARGSRSKPARWSGVSRTYSFELTMPGGGVAARGRGLVGVGAADPSPAGRADPADGGHARRRARPRRTGRDPHRVRELDLRPLRLRRRRVAARDHRRAGAHHLRPRRRRRRSNAIRDARRGRARRCRRSTTAPCTPAREWSPGPTSGGSRSSGTSWSAGRRRRSSRSTPTPRVTTTAMSSTTSPARGRADSSPIAVCRSSTCRPRRRPRGSGCGASSSASISSAPWRRRTCRSTIRCVSSSTTAGWVRVDYVNDHLWLAPLDPLAVLRRAHVHGARAGSSSRRTRPTDELDGRGRIGRRRRELRRLRPTLPISCATRPCSACACSAGIAGASSPPPAGSTCATRTRSCSPTRCSSPRPRPRCSRFF